MLKISHENVYTLYTYIFCKFLSFLHYNIAYSKGHLTDMLESTVVVIRASSFQCQQSKSDDKVNKSRALEDAKQKKRGIIKSFNQEVKT